MWRGVQFTPIGCPHARHVRPLASHEACTGNDKRLQRGRSRPRSSRPGSVPEPSAPAQEIRISRTRFAVLFRDDSGWWPRRGRLQAASARSADSRPGPKILRSLLLRPSEDRHGRRMKRLVHSVQMFWRCSGTARLAQRSLAATRSAWAAGAESGGCSSACAGCGVALSSYLS